MKLSPEAILRHQDSIIKGWPNTYTFSKNLAERILQKHREDVPLMIIRPAIVLPSFKEPVPGWMDAVSAGGPLTAMFVMGIWRCVPCDKYSRHDFIPLDIVANSIILGAAYQAKKNSLNILHASSSHTNPIGVYEYSNNVFKYASKHPFFPVFRQPRKRLDNLSPNAYAIRFYLENTLPAKLITKTSEILGGDQRKN